jgi:hypothetical protein
MKKPWTLPRISYFVRHNLGLASQLFDGFFGVEGGVPQDPSQPGAFAGRSVSGNDLRNVLSVRSMRYRSANERGIQLATVDGDTANTGNTSFSGYETANVIGDPNAISKRTAAEYFNTAAYAAPPQFTFGTSGTNSLRTQGYWDLDTSFFRQLLFDERYKLEFRGEGFNLLNHPSSGIQMLTSVISRTSGW